MKKQLALGRLDAKVKCYEGNNKKNKIYKIHLKTHNLIKNL